MKDRQPGEHNSKRAQVGVSGGLKTTRQRRAGWVSGLGVATILGMTESAAQEKHFFDIPEESTPEALEAYQRQAHVSISYDPEVHVRTHAIYGTLTPRKALDELLKGSRLTYEFRSDSRVVIESASLAAALPVNAPADELREVMSEVTVTVTPTTGTLLSDTEPVGAFPITLGQADFEHAGVATVGEFLRLQTQVFNGGPSEDTRLISAEAQSNAGFGTGVNLRGVGARATLVLINGRRSAPSGTEASFVDVDQIAPEAIDHIDILPDGGSAFYGSDAVGGVVNVVLKDRFSGAQMLGETGRAPKGGRNYYRLSQRVGREWDSGHLFLNVDWYRQDALAAGARPFARSNLAFAGGPNLETPASNPPTLNYAGHYYAVPPGVTGPLDFGTLKAGTQNLSDPYDHADILPYQNRLGLDLAIRQTLGKRWNGSLDVLFSDRGTYEHEGGDRTPVVFPDSPLLSDRPKGPGLITLLYNFQNTLGVVQTFSHVRTFNIALGLDTHFDSGMSVSFVASDVWETEHQTILDQANPSGVASALASSSFNPFVQDVTATPATLATMRAHPDAFSRSEFRSLSGVINGPLLSVWDREVKWALGSELRYQLFHTELSPNPMILDLHRNMAAVFSEVDIPVFGPGPSFAGLQDLTLSIAGRFEDYDDFGPVRTPRVGVTWKPMLDLVILGTWGREIRAPNLGDLYELENASWIASLADPAAPGGKSRVLLVSGNNSGLGAERAITRTIGFRILPLGPMGLHFDTRFFSITFTDRIQSTPYEPTLLSDPNVAGIVTRNPSAVSQRSICDNPDNHFAGSLADCLTPVAALVDLRTLNLGTLKTDGFDASAGVTLAPGMEKFSLDLGATYLMDFSETNMPKTPTVHVLNTSNHPINLRAMGSLRWERREVGAGISVNYSNSYHDVVSIPARNIGAWTTVDLQLSYKPGEGSGRALKDFEVVLGIKNAFGKQPPFAVDRPAAIGYDQENADPLGRVMSIKLSKRF
jgi:iron complex outermembrane recepter protein